MIQHDGGWSIYEDVAREVDAILAVQVDDGARLIYPQARQGFADTESSSDTGSTVDVEKTPACLLARLCSGKTQSMVLQELISKTFATQIKMFASSPCSARLATIFRGTHSHLRRPWPSIRVLRKLAYQTSVWP